MRAKKNIAILMSLLLCACFFLSHSTLLAKNKKPKKNKQAKLYLPKYHVDQEKFYARLDAPTPQWMLDQIEEDLAPFTTELSRHSLDRLFQGDELLLVRVRVVDGHLSIHKSKSAKAHPTSDQIIPHFFALNKLKKLPDIDLIFTAHDGLAISPPAPIFAITKFRSMRGTIVMPDWFSLNGLEPLKSLILEGNQLYPWESKKDVVFYRGADNGIFDLSEWEADRRPKLVALSSQHPHLIDAKFHQLYATWHLPYAIEKGYMSEYVSLKEHPRYKYLISVDAVVAATPRFPLLLHSNSVVLKDNTDSILWFFKAIKPYEHYIPIAGDLSNLFSQIEWAKEHDEECARISTCARQLASEILTHEAIYLYLYRLLEAYSAKQQTYY